MPMVLVLLCKGGRCQCYTVELMSRVLHPGLELRSK